MTKIIALVVVGSLASLACSAGKKSEDKSVLNKVNGENYSADTVAGVPIVKSNDRWTMIQGQIVFTNPTFDPSTGTQNVQLLRNGKVVGQASTNPDGTFEFKGKYENGDYQVKVNSKTLVGSAPLIITGYEVKDFVLPATLTAPKKR